MQINSNFIFDLDAIRDFIFGGGINERNCDVEITETQIKNSDTGKLETESKITREVKSANTNKQTISYDLVKMFIDILGDVEIDQELAPLSLGQKMVINTMANYGLIKEIKG